MHGGTNNMDQMNFDRLRAKIAESRRMLDAQERALDLVEAMTKMSDLTQPNLPGMSEPPTSVQSRPIVRVRRAAPPTQRKSKVERPPQKQLLKEAIDKLGDEEFTVNMLNDVLIKDGNKFAGHKPQNRITVLLGVLMTEGYVKRTFEGGGNVAKKYRKVDQNVESPLL